MAKGDRNLGWPGFFRAFAVLCAIMLLLAQTTLERYSVDSGAWQVLSIYEGVTSWAIPALFMLWGMFALEGGGKPSFSGCMLHLVLPTFGLLVFWGAVYAIVSTLLSGGSVGWDGVVQALISAAKGNTHYHLWVLYPLIGLYLVHPVIHRFTSSASRGEIIYFLALCCLFTSVLPMWAAFHPDSLIVGLLERLRVHLVLGWVGCYVAGWYLRHYTIGRLSEILCYLAGIVGMVFTLLGDRMVGGGRELWYLYTSPNVIAVALAFCVLFRYVLGVSDERSRRASMYELGAYAFGIYLLHPIWVLILAHFDIGVWSFTPVVSVPFFALLVFLLSVPFAWLVYRIPGVGSYLT